MAPVDWSSSLQGRWRDGEGELLEIRGSKIHGPNGPPIDLEVNGRFVKMFACGEVFEGTLASRGRLVWDDGAVWKSLQAEPEPESGTDDEVVNEVSEAPSSPKGDALFDFDDLDEVLPEPEAEVAKSDSEDEVLSVDGGEGPNPSAFPERSSPTLNASSDGRQPESPPGEGQLFDFDDLDDAQSEASVHFKPEPKPEPERRQPSPPPRRGQPPSMAGETWAAPSASSSSASRPSAREPNMWHGHPNAPRSSGWGRAGQSSQPLAEEDAETKQLRRQCEESGMPVSWCTDASVMASLMAKVHLWQGYGICALKDELSALRLPPSGYADSQRELILPKMKMALVWQHLSVEQLQAECTRRKIPFYKTSQLQSLIDDSDDEGEKQRKRKDEQADLVRRLMQDTFPGAQGPLPAQGIAGYWTPTHAKGEPPLPAWTDPRQPAAPQGGAAPPPWNSGPAPGAPPWGQQRQQAPPPESSWEKERPSWWYGREPGPRVRKVLRGLPKAFCYFGPPIDDGADMWTEAHIKAFFLSNGRDRPSGLPQAEPARPEAAREHYEALDLQPGADRAAVKQAYHRLVLKFHPDKNAQEHDAANFRRIREAYEEINKYL